MYTISKKKLNNFKAFLIENERAKSTIEKYIHDISAFCIWLSGSHIDKSVVIKYKNYLLENYEISSVNSILSSLNSFFVYLGWYELRVKTVRVQKQIFAKTEKELTKTEYKRLILTAKAEKNERLYLVMQTICSSGIRVSELRYITVDAINNGVAEINCKGKCRFAFIPKTLCCMLKDYCRRKKLKSGPVFVTKKGNPLDRSNIWSEMKKLCQSANVSPDKVFPHNLRHLFARTYYTLQKDIVRLADILGHSSVNTTRIYTMETGEIHRKQIQDLGLLQC